ncbi:hypothetical protein G6F35_018673 [Rhizopus arrhizus]|nr:hypothetical protein G6F35_018673 [Rhizopus arrhizus]
MLTPAGNWFASISAMRACKASSTSDGFSPLRISTMPNTASSLSSCPTRPCRGSPVSAMLARSRTRIGVPPRCPTTTLPMSAGERIRPTPRIRNCCWPRST